MGKGISDKLESELAEWRARFERLRVKANLGKMDLRDKERELADQFEPAYRQAMQKLDEWGESAGHEAKAMKTGLEAGWRELRKTYAAARDDKQSGQKKP